MARVTTIRVDDTFTADALAELPDDGRRYELLDGLLLVTPAPRVLHQLVCRALFRLLDAAAPPGC